MIIIAITRPGKDTIPVEVPKGSTVEEALIKGNISSSDYSSWTFTDEDGDTLTKSSKLESSTALICGQKVVGA